MCMIVDTNKFGAVLADPVDADVQPIIRWLRRRRGNIVYSLSGKYGNELNKSPNARSRLEQFKAAGFAHLVDGENLEKHSDLLLSTKNLRSDDPHVLALAIVSGARLLFTGDNRLMADFKDRDIINGSRRGKIYSGVRNASMLDQAKCS